MPDYAAGKIYVIRNRAAGDGVVYVGSTTQTLCERMNGHRRKVGRSTMKIQQLMGNVGVDNFHIELLADFPCERREQLTAEEGRHIRVLRPECNMNIAGRTSQEWQREKREANPDIYAARAKAWREANPGVDAARAKAWSDAHPGVKAAREKAWWDAHPGANAARSKAYRERKKAERLAAAVDAATAGVAAAAIV